MGASLYAVIKAFFWPDPGGFCLLVFSFLLKATRSGIQPFASPIPEGDTAIVLHFMEDLVLCFGFLRGSCPRAEGAYKGATF